MDYDDYGCESLGDGKFIVYYFLEHFKENVAIFTLNEDGSHEETIYPKFKGVGLSYLIKLFVKDIKSNQEKKYG